MERACGVHVENVAALALPRAAAHVARAACAIEEDLSNAALGAYDVVLAAPASRADWSASLHAGLAFVRPGGGMLYLFAVGFVPDLVHGEFETSTPGVYAARPELFSYVSQPRPSAWIDARASAFRNHGDATFTRDRLVYREDIEKNRAGAPSAASPEAVPYEDLVESLSALRRECDLPCAVRLDTLCDVYREIWEAGD